MVVDNDSHDGTPEMVRDSFPQVKLIAWGENKGFSAAINEAARHATGDVFLLLNPDAVELPAGATRRMLSALRGLTPMPWPWAFVRSTLRGTFSWPWA